jgi:glutathione-regulated potassium-efflux system ancillary protein KefG
MKKNKVLVLFAHPAIQKSRVNKALSAVAKEVTGVTFHDLYQSYPDGVIDIETEQALLKDHDVILFQHPFYWYSTPALIKEWLDLVLEYGFAYGPGGNALLGKAWGHVISTGGPIEAYTAQGHNRYTIAQFLTPLEQSAILCNTTFLPPFVTHAAHRFQSSQDLIPVQNRYRQFLTTLIQFEGSWTQWSFDHT